MYSLEINFLKDRPGIVPSPGTDEGRKKNPSSINDKLLMYAGVAVGIMLPAAVGGFWFWQQTETSNLELEKTNVTALIGKVAAEQGKLAQITKETKEFQQQTPDLSTVFNQMKPWSALLQELREKLPAGVQISGITQTKPSPETAPPPPPAGTTVTQLPVAAPTTDKIEITGIANSFSKVNDFLLTLQKSSFFKDKDTKLISAGLMENPLQLYEPQTTNQAAGLEPLPKLPQVVSFKIETYLSEKPATSMLAELESKGALGLVTRIENLKQQGVLKP